MIQHYFFVHNDSTLFPRDPNHKLQIHHILSHPLLFLQWNLSVPAAIRSSADWKNTRKNKKCRRRNTEKSSITCDHKHASSSFSSSFQDVWCGPGIGFASDHASASVDCVVARKNASSRRNLDAVERATHREEVFFFLHHHLLLQFLLFSFLFI